MSVGPLSHVSNVYLSCTRKGNVLLPLSRGMYYLSLDHYNAAFCNRRNRSSAAFLSNCGAFSVSPLIGKLSCQKLFKCGLRMQRFGDHKNVSKAVSKAEKIVGYPTSFLSLRCLLSDELSNVAMQMHKLVGTNHPLLKTARGLVFCGRHNLQMRGLLVMLISKAAGPNPHDLPLVQDMVSGVYPSQRSLAEITEIIHTANLIHKGVVNLADLKPEDGLLADMEFGNKMAILSGDFLLASACSGLAKLGSPRVVEHVASSIADMMTAEFTKLTDPSGSLGLSVLGATIGFSDWMRHTFLAVGSLLAKSCQSAMMLAGHSKTFEEMAFSFGQNLTYSYQIGQDLLPFLKTEELSNLSLSSSPILLYKEKTSLDEFAQLKDLWETGPICHKKIVTQVVNSGMLDLCQELCYNYRDKAISALQCFPPSDAKDALVNMATVMSSVR